MWLLATLTAPTPPARSTETNSGRAQPSVQLLEGIGEHFLASPSFGELVVEVLFVVIPERHVATENHHDRGSARAAIGGCAGRRESAPVLCVTGEADPQRQGRPYDDVPDAHPSACAPNSTAHRLATADAT